MSGGPLLQVLAAFEAGVSSLAQVGARTGLPADTVEAAVAHLVRMGRLEARALVGRCLSSGCGTCPLGTIGNQVDCPGRRTLMYSTASR